MSPPISDRKKRPQSAGLRTGQTDPFLRFQGFSKDGGAPQTRTITQLAATFSNPIDMLNLEYRRAWTQALNEVGEPNLTRALQIFEQQLRPFFIDTPKVLAVDKRSRKSLPYMRNLAAAIVNIPDEPLRTVIIENMLQNKGDTFAYGFLREAAARAVLSVKDEATRNRLIEKACNSSGWFGRLAAVELVPYHTNPTDQSYLRDKLLSDSTDEVKTLARKVFRKTGITMTPPPLPTHSLVLKGQVTPSAEESIDDIEAWKLAQQIESLQNREQDPLLALNPSKQTVVSSDEILKSFADQAKTYYENKTPYWRRLFHRAQHRKNIGRISRWMMEAALMTGQLSPTQWSDESIGKIELFFRKKETLHTQKEKAEALLADLQSGQKRLEVSQKNIQESIVAKEKTLATMEEKGNNNALWLTIYGASQALQLQLKLLADQQRLNEKNTTKAQISLKDISQKVAQFDEQMQQALVYQLTANVGEQLEAIQSDVDKELEDPKLADALEACEDKKRQMQSEPVLAVEESDLERQIRESLNAARVEHLTRQGQGSHSAVAP